LIENGKSNLDEPRIVEGLSRIRVEYLSVTVLVKNK
jgi:pullulanase